MTPNDYIERYDPQYSGSEAMLYAALQAAQTAAETYLGRGFGTATNVQEVHRGAAQSVCLRHYPVTAVTSIKDENGELPDGSCDLDEEAGILYMRAPHKGNVIVKYSGGAGEEPMDVQLAIGLLTKSMLSSLDNNGQTVASERLGDWQVSYATGTSASAEAGIVALCPAARNLLHPYKVVRV